MMTLLALAAASYVKIDPITTTYSDLSATQNYNYYYIDIEEQSADRNVSFNYTFNTDGNTKNVYFVFSNISPSEKTSYPLISSSTMVDQNIVPTTSLKPKSLVAGSQTRKGKPEISEFNRRPYAFLNKINPVNMLLNIVASTEPKFDSVGSHDTFKIDASSTIDARCIAKNTDGARTLNLWVADDCASLSYKTPVTELANLFLTGGSDNDIYDWVTNIYGEEWGPVSASADPDGILIAPNNEITILLLDIDSDKSPSSGVLGYFWAKDNFKSSYISYSNERIMFYMDAYLFANYPEEIISALAHEFQHMIHFYQKTVLLTDGNGTETWIDEMSSMVTEDLVADKLGVEGPRGVSVDDYPDGSAGTNKNTSGRLPYYIYFNDASVTSWYTGDNVIISYSINYALGAYLARNYGGPQFFYDVIHNNYTDHQAIEYALTQYGSANRFGDILRRWGVATLLSDKTNTSSEYQYNNGSWFTDPMGATSYSTGSINMYNYRYTSSTSTQDGPYTYSENYPMPITSMPAGSNQYYRAAVDLNGSKTWHIKLKSNVRMTVLAK